MSTTPQNSQGLSPEEEQKELDFKVRVELLKSEDDALRENAAVELGCLGDMRAVDPLMEALRDKEWPVRFSAAEALVQLPDARAVGALIECIADNHGGVRDKAGCALQAIGEPAVAPLVAALGHEKAEIRKQVIYVLGELRRILGESMDAHAVEAMLNALKDPAPAVREAAAACVREFRLSHAEVRVVEALKDERFGTRLYSVQKLTDIARSGDSGKDSALPHLIGAIEDPQIGPVAAEGLGTIGDPRAVEPLLASLERDDMRQIGVTALLRIGEPSVLPLIEKMKSENPALRAEVAWGLGMLRDPRAVEALAAASEDEAAEVRRNAVMALGLIRDARAVEPLLKALADDSLAEEAKDSLVPIGGPAVEPLLAKLEGSSGRLRRDILWVLGMIRDPRAVESLIVALKDDDPEIRAVAIQGLGFVRDARGVAPLIEAMREDRFANNVVQALVDLGEPAVEPLIVAMESSEQDLLVRQKAAKTLGMIKDARAVDPLIRALQDPVLRHAAATALVEFRAVATSRLIEVMQDENPEIRAHAAAALGHLMDGQALPALLLAVGDSEPSVRAQAARALGRMEDRRALPELIGALKDVNSGVRVEAVRALGFLKEKQAVGPLIELFADDELRGEASEALFQIGVPAVEPLIAALAIPDVDSERPSESSPVESEPQPAVKAGEAGAVVVETPPSKSLESVIPVSVSPEPPSDVPERERESGSETEATEVTEPAHESGESGESTGDTSWMRRKEAAWTLGMIRDKRAVEPLIAALRHDVHQVRIGAIEALGRMEAEAAVAALIDVMKTDWRLRKLAAESLILVGEAAYHPVFALKESELDQDLRAVARWVLEGIGRLACEADEREAAEPPKDLVRELDEIY